MPLYLAMQRHKKRLKVSDDLDCLPPDATSVYECEGYTFEEGKTRAVTLEEKGWIICLDFDGQFYETGEEVP